MNMKLRRLFWWTLGSVTTLLCIGLILAAYQFGWSGSGFQGKTVWDWLQLLIIPLVLALAAIIFNQTNARTERQIAKQRYEQDLQIAQDKQREDLLQTYLSQISELLLKENLRNSGPDDEVRKVARVRTISILLQLNPQRIEYVFKFLFEALLVDHNDPLVDLTGAKFSKVHWEGADIYEINLKSANFSEANLSNTKFHGTNFTRADFSGANLSRASLLGLFLEGSNFERADLTGARIIRAGLVSAKLTGANFSGADLSGTRFSKSWLNDANFSGANLRDAQLDQCDLSNVNFTGANLEKANLKGSVIDKSRLSSEQIAQAIF